MKKRLLAFILATTMVFSATACSKDNTKKDETQKEKTTTSEKSQKEEVKRPTASYADTAIIYEVNVRQYTEEGTFNAFSKHLERLKDMGINTLWFMPIYDIAEEGRKGSLGSYYAIKDYKTVNDEFGTMEDFKALVDKAHEMGFKVMLDWVANHTGWDHTWIKEHNDFYKKDDTGNIIWPEGTDWDDVAQLDYDNKDMRAAMIDAMKFWITEVDVDGFRCDYASGVPADFWNEAREELNKVKEIYMLAEDGPESNALLISAFESDYSFGLYNTLVAVTTGSKHVSDLQYDIAPKLPAGSFKMNFIENHDKNSYDKSLEERFGKDAINALTTLIFTLKGAPLVYSGQEEGITKTLAFFEKDLIPFGTYEYAPLITKLSSIKTNHAVLNNITGGDIEVLNTGNDDVLAFTRQNDEESITVVMNLSKKDATIDSDDFNITGDTLLHGDSDNAALEENGDVELKKGTTIKAFEYYVICK